MGTTHCRLSHFILHKNNRRLKNHLHNITSGHYSIERINSNNSLSELKMTLMTTF